MSPAPDSTLPNPQQIIADLERRLAKRTAERNALRRELAAAAEQQTASAEVLQVINSSPGDIGPVFDAMLEKALRLCDAAFGHLINYDGEYLSLAAAKGEQRAVEWLRQRGPARPGPGTTMERIARGEPLVHIADVADDAAYRHGEPTRKALVEIGGCRTLLSIALRRDTALLGAISVYRQEVRPFSEKQIALLENFAAQAVIAMENARLLTETREALDQQTATAEVLRVINSSPGDLAPVFDAILEKAHKLCDIAFGSLQLHQGGRFRAVAVRGVAHSLAELLRRPMDPRPGSPPLRLLQGERFVQIDDLFESAKERPDDPRAHASAEHGLRTALFVPLRKDAELLGYISAFRMEIRPFSEKEIALLENFAAQAVIVMENARLITETREALEQQAATADVLGVIASFSGGLEPVFNKMLEHATRICTAECAMLALLEDNGFRGAAVKGFTPQMAEHLSDIRQPSPGTGLYALQRTKHTHQVLDAAAEPAYDYVRAGVPEFSKIRTILHVPMLRDGELIGGIVVYRLEARAFSEKETALLENFADQAVIAIENARLLGELRRRTEEIAELNRGLEARVADQVDELERVGRLKRFLAPQLAELIVSQGDEKILESHRREIVVVFCDLRGYTAFTETAEPEEVLDFLREYHGALGPLVAQYEGTLDQFSGDGIMVFFNDPVPIPDPAERAVKMAMDMREAAGRLIATLRRRRGRELGFGVGIAQGYATLGQIGFADRSGYTAIGTVCNLAARLCAEAKDGQILVAQPVAVAVEETVALEEMGSLTLKGLTQPVVAFNVLEPPATGASAEIVSLRRGREAQ